MAQDRRRQSQNVEDGPDRIGGDEEMIGRVEDEEFEDDEMDNDDDIEDEEIDGEE
jgi:hypothetical protein